MGEIADHYVYRIKPTRDRPDADLSDVDTDFGGNIGGGLEWALPSSETVKLFGELAYRFHEVEADYVVKLDFYTSELNGAKAASVIH